MCVATQHSFLMQIAHATRRHCTIANILVPSIPGEYPVPTVYPSGIAVPVAVEVLQLIFQASGAIFHLFTSSFPFPLSCPCPLLHHPQTLFYLCPSPPSPGDPLSHPTSFPSAPSVRSSASYSSSPASAVSHFWGRCCESPSWL